MNRITPCILILFILFACNNKYKARNSIKISIEKLNLDNTSIRALEIINDSSVVYAGSQGEIGIVSEFERFIAPKKIINDSVALHFRALAHTSAAVYALSIGNPAMLYQYKNSEMNLVYSEVDDDVFYDSMHFFDDLNGIAIGDPVGDCLSIILTKDGGNTWNKIECSNLPPIIKGEAAFAASDTNIAVFEKNAWVATGGKAARVFHTNDMGLS